MKLKILVPVLLGILLLSVSVFAQDTDIILPEKGHSKLDTPLFQYSQLKDKEEVRQWATTSVIEIFRGRGVIASELKENYSLNDIILPPDGRISSTYERWFDVLLEAKDIPWFVEQNKAKVKSFTLYDFEQIYRDGGCGNVNIHTYRFDTNGWWQEFFDYVWAAIYPEKIRLVIEFTEKANDSTMSSGLYQCFLASKKFVVETTYANLFQVAFPIFPPYESLEKRQRTLIEIADHPHTRLIRRPFEPVPAAITEINYQAEELKKANLTGEKLFTYSNPGPLKLTKPIPSYIYLLVGIGIIVILFLTYYFLKKRKK